MCKLREAIIDCGTDLSLLFRDEMYICRPISIKCIGISSRRCESPFNCALEILLIVALLTYLNRATWAARKTPHSVASPLEIFYRANMSHRHYQSRITSNDANRESARCRCDCTVYRAFAIISSTPRTRRSERQCDNYNLKSHRRRNNMYRMNLSGYVGHVTIFS